MSGRTFCSHNNAPIVLYHDYFPHLFGFISAIPSVYEVGGITRKIVYHAFDEALHSNRYFKAVRTLGDLGA